MCMCAKPCKDIECYRERAERLQEIVYQFADAMNQRVEESLRLERRLTSLQLEIERYDTMLDLVISDRDSERQEARTWEDRAKASNKSKRQLSQENARLRKELDIISGAYASLLAESEGDKALLEEYKGMMTILPSDYYNREVVPRH
jgi:chromosome segregation ATPase